MATVITTPAQLQNVSADLTADYELGNNINMAGVAFNPLGGWGGADNFTGTFDGKGYSIFSLSIAKNGDNEVGLFGTTEDATIQNVILNNPTVHGDDFTGALIGLIVGDDTISNCQVVGGSVTGEDFVGGLVGYAVGTIVFSNCSTSCSVTSDAGAAASNNDIGGFIGYADGADFDECYASGDVVGIGENVGGFAGLLASCTWDKCFSSGDVSTGNNGGDSYCGGFVGTSTGAASDCYASGDVTATGEYVGGFSGVSPTTMDNCYSVGAVAGVGAGVGGLNGNLGGDVTNCFWDTETSGQAASFGGTGKTTAEMKLVGTFQAAGWAISRIWNVLSNCNGGYPCLIDVNACCTVRPSPVDQTILGNKVTLEAIRNLEIVYGGRFYIDKSGNAVYESRHHRNT